VQERGAGAPMTDDDHRIIRHREGFQLFSISLVFPPGVK